MSGWLGYQTAGHGIGQVKQRRPVSAPVMSARDRSNMQSDLMQRHRMTVKLQAGGGKLEPPPSLDTGGNYWGNGGPGGPQQRNHSARGHQPVKPHNPKPPPRARSGWRERPQSTLARPQSAATAKPAASTAGAGGPAAADQGVTQGGPTRLVGQRQAGRRSQSARGSVPGRLCPAAAGGPAWGLGRTQGVAPTQHARRIRSAQPAKQQWARGDEVARQHVEPSGMSHPARRAGPNRIIDVAHTELEELLEQLKREGDHNGDEFDEATMQAHRHCFQRLLDEFRLHRPLLSAIKDEHDQYLEYFHTRVMKIRPRLQEAQSLAARTDAEISRINEQFGAKRKELEVQLARAQSRRDKATGRRSKLRQQLSERKTQLQAAQENNVGMKETKQMLTTSLMRFSRELEKWHAKQDENDRGATSYQSRMTDLKKQLVNLRDADTHVHVDIEQAAVEVTSLVEEFGRLKSRKVDVIKDLEHTHTERQEVQGKLQEVGTKLRSLNRSATTQCPSFCLGIVIKAFLAVLTLPRSVWNRSAGPSTPRPDWKLANEAIPELSLNFPVSAEQAAEGVIAKDNSEGEVLTRPATTLELGQALVKQTADIRKDMAETEEALAGLLVKDNEAEVVVNEVKWFVCHGSGPNVPRFLRGTGKVRNRSLAKAPIEQLLEEFWAAKVQASPIVALSLCLGAPCLWQGF